MRRLSIQNSLVNVMARAVLEATRGLNRDFLEISHLLNNRRGTDRFVSIGERKVSEVLIESLTKARPDFGFIVEGKEPVEGKGRDRNWSWVIDPVDGTNNFARGIPHFSCSLGVYNGTSVIAAMTYDVIKDEMFYAYKGEGAFLDDIRLKVSEKEVLSQTMLAVRANKQCSSSISKLIDNAAYIRSFGATSLDLAYVAAGRLDGVFIHSTRSWDVIAGVLLIKEAGGGVYNIKNKPFNALSNEGLIAGNNDLCYAISDLIGK